MANPEHLRRTRYHWSDWNNQRPEAPDLQGANLVGAQLSKFNLSNANLRGANLSGAELYMTNLRRADLASARCASASFNNANLQFATLSGSELSEATLSSADASHADLSRVMGAKCDLQGTNLENANLQDATFEDANFFRANLKETIFNRTGLHGANMTGASMGGTVLADLDLQHVRGLETVLHLRPSSIGVDTLYRSGSCLSDEFLRKCGIPAVMITYLPSLTSLAALEFYSTFISYSHADLAFADHVYQRLFHDERISCWKDDHNMNPGDIIDAEIDKALKSVDKVLLVCSETTLSGPSGSWWVDREITRALQKEEQLSRARNETVNILIPIDIDGYLFSPACDYYRAADLKARVVQSFKGWQHDNTILDNGFTRIINALRASGPNFVFPPPKI